MYCVVAMSVLVVVIVVLVGVIVVLVVGVTVVLVVGVTVVLVVGVTVVLVVGVLEGCVVATDEESVEDGAAVGTGVVDEVPPHSGRCCCLPVRHALISRSDTVDCVTLASNDNSNSPQNSVDQSGFFRIQLCPDSDEDSMRLFQVVIYV